MGGAESEGQRENLDAIRSVVFKESETLDVMRFKKISGYDFNRGVDFRRLIDSMVFTGFQASNLGDAVEVVNQMLDWRLSHEKPTEDCTEEELDPAYRESVRCKIFLGFTSNLVSSGVRDIIRFLVEHRMVDVVVTTAGGIEEDLIKCLAPTYRGDFSLPGAYLRSKGLNRIGNLLVPNDNYCKFENWINPILDQMLEEQLMKNVDWTPSKVISRLGKEINDENIRSMNGEAVHAGIRKTGMIILGGGLPKHHICNANMMRNGSDYAVFINTAQEFDGSDSGAQPDEAVSWGKIRGSAKTVKIFTSHHIKIYLSNVHCDATIAFPLLVAATFARRFEDTSATATNN
ncbi:Deoxyhypusine synthase [Dendrobium catenatum]|uniref:Deoxyhypusine synthase n=1 Tax=Dendrobium catenatum TaxID=906689 RepID=A0A2I0WXA6_9ASPA|nr:Deoxyhypusine synthase [Dendrobium catenatum]